MATAVRATSDVQKPRAMVLVVDDDEFVRDAVTAVLEQGGFAAEACSDAMQALTQLRAGLLPDLILLDLRLPGIDGWEFRLIQREHRQWMEIPVIAFSADSSAKAAAIDAEAFLVKPIVPRELLQTVERLLEVIQRRRAPNQVNDAERLRDLGGMATGIAQQVTPPLSALAENLKVAERKMAELEARLGGAEAFGMIGIRQLLQTAERSAERVQAVLQGIARFSELALHTVQRRRRVLIAHSEQRLVALLHEALHGEYELVTATTGAQALQALSEDGFDAFLCELRLPDIHGIDLYARLLADKPEQACRTVFVTAGDVGERERTFFMHYRPWQLRAPFKASDVRELIEAHWRALH